MKKNKHTPGPWRLQIEKDYCPPDMGMCMIVENDVPDRDDSARHIAFAFGDSEQSRADAHLLAAAPDLLEAIIPFVSRGLFEGYSIEEWNDFQEAARNAIKKAKGLL